MSDDEELTTPGLGIDECWQILCRRRWWLLLPLFGGWLLIWAISWVLPASYRSETTVLIERQKVPEEYVASNVDVDPQQQIVTITQEIMSRTRLQQLISQFNLYPDLRRRGGDDDAIDRMKKDIGTPDLVQAPGKSGLTAFSLHYDAPTPQLSQQVLSQLTSLFIDEHIQNVTNQSVATTDFISSELDDARNNLTQQENRVKDFKAKYIGALPTEKDSNLQILQGLQTQSMNLAQRLSAAEQNKMVLDSLRSQYKSLNVGAGADDSATLTGLDQELSRLRASLTEAQTKYTDRHPDVVYLRDQIAKTEKRRADIEAELTRGQSKSKRITRPADLAMATSQIEAEGKLRAVEQEIRDTKNQIRNVDGQIAVYRARLNLTPVREQQLAGLTRDYDQSKENYDSLLKKQQQSQLATNLEKRQQGQQFRLLDPPSLPQKAYSPNRLQFSLIGLGVGLLLGVGCIALMELVDKRVRSEQDVQELVHARVLVGIPHLSTPEEERRVRRQHIKEWCAAAAMAAMICAGNLLTYLRG